MHSGRAPRSDWEGSICSLWQGLFAGWGISGVVSLKPGDWRDVCFAVDIHIRTVIWRVLSYEKPHVADSKGHFPCNNRLSSQRAADSMSFHPPAMPPSPSFLSTLLGLYHPLAVPYISRRFRHRNIFTPRSGSLYSLLSPPQPPQYLHRTGFPPVPPAWGLGHSKHLLVSALNPHPHPHPHPHSPRSLPRPSRRSRSRSHSRPRSQSTAPPPQLQSSRHERRARRLSLRSGVSLVL